MGYRAPSRQRTHGRNPLSVLEPSALILNLGFERQYFFQFLHIDDKRTSRPAR
jgi:hypothetical protein